MKKILLFLVLLSGIVNAQSPFLTDSTGTITGVEITLPNEPSLASGIVRKARLIRKTEDADLEVTVLVHIDCYDTQGRKMLTVIANDTASSITSRQLRSTRFATFAFTKTTRDSWVNPSTGNIVPKGTAGAIRELKYFQGITSANLGSMGLPVTNTTPNLVAQYWLLAAMIQTLITRDGL